jgi:uncharacterized protein (TIGR02231 family)
MQRKVIFLLFFLFFILCAALFSDEIVTQSSISAVTVFPDRASVTREADLTLVPGIHSIVFSGLPATLIPNSVRVSGKGTAQVKVLGVDISTQFLESSLLPEINRLQKEIDNVQLEIDKIKDKVDVLESQEKFLKSIEASTSSQASQEILLGKPDVQSWEKVINFLSAKLQDVKQSKLECKKILAEQAAKLDALKKKLESIKPQKPLEGKRVTVLLESSRSGDFKLNLFYTVINARWSPLYTLRAIPDSSEIELSFQANIQQISGEDWEDVDALLSTSSPALATNPPVLNPWILDIYVPRAVVKMEKAKIDRGGVIGGVVGGVLGGVVGEVEAPVEAEMASAGVVEIGLHLNFEIKRKVQIPSDGAPHKVPIDSQKMNVKFNYICAPKLKEAAFLRGKLKNTLAYPLLSGKADIFILQDYVGSAALPFVAAEEEAEMFFGEDSQVRVKYEQVKREKTAPGFLSKTEKLRLVCKITIQNLRKYQVEAEILDQFPVSQNSKIEVKEVNISPAPTKKDEKGILSWVITLAPQEKREILIDFTIEYPKDATIIGL